MWVTGGMVAAVGLTAALLATLGGIAIAWQHEPARVSASGKRSDIVCTARQDSHLPSAA
jgi:hypothetical protein